MKKLILGCLVIIMSGLISGCAMLPFPQCNERFNQDAMLVTAAKDMHVCLDEVGNGLILANGVAISMAKLYTAEQALRAVNEWVGLLQAPILDTVFQNTVYDSIGAFPELIILTDAFTVYFSQGEIIDQPSRELLISYLENRVVPMLEKRLSLK